MRNDRLELGAWNITCQRCGFKYKNYQIRKEHTGLLVCHGSDTNNCWDKEPQTRFRIPEPIRIPWSRPEAADNFIHYARWSDAIQGLEATGAVGNLSLSLSLAFT